MKTKSILVLLLTLIIGFVLGMLTSAQIRHHRLRPVKFFFSEEKMRDSFYQTIKPDDHQKADLEPILDKYAKINKELYSNFRKEMDESISNLRKEIDSKLTKEQLARLKEMDKKRQEMIKHGRKRYDRDSSESRNKHWHHKTRTDSLSVHDDTLNLPDKK